MNYREVLDYLSDANEFQAMRLGLDNTRTILTHLPVDISGIPFIQVAGSNGKGSTSHFIASILQAAGYKTGLFTSPHLLDIRERIMVNKEWIHEDEFAGSFTIVKDLSEKLLKKGIIQFMPSYFEYTFLVAVHYFFTKKVDVAILEVGLGGRLDATSTITPVVSVITSISLEHTHILGRRLTEIAAEKAGIIKEGVPVVCGCKPRSVAHRVIKRIASAHHAPFFNVTDSQRLLKVEEHSSYYRCSFETPSEEIHYDVRMNGIHQSANAAAAITAIRVLTDAGTIRPIPGDIIASGISTATIPARIENIPAIPPVILDGSHNVESISALATYLEEKKKSNLTLIFGVLSDKNYKKMVSILLPFIDTVILTLPHSPRAVPCDRLQPIFRRKKKSVFVIDTITEAYEFAHRLNREILITGSFYLVGVMRDLILRAQSQTGGPHE